VIERAILAAGAIAMAAGVALGADAAHAGKDAVHPEAARLLLTAVQYHLVHGLGILAIGLASRGDAAARRYAIAAALLLAGIVLFCGSLWYLALTGHSPGAVAPAGGLAFIAGWIAFAACVLLRR